VLPITPELVLAPYIFLALLSIDVMARALSSARRSSREQTSNARVTLSQLRPFPKLHALVLPSSLSSLPPFFSNCCASFLSASAKKGGSCTDVILSAIIIGGIIIAVQARRYESPRPVVGDAPVSIGGRFLDRHDFGSDSRWHKLYYMISHTLSLNDVAFLYIRLDSTRPMVGYDDIGMAPSSSQLGLEISEDSDWTSPNGLVENPGDEETESIGIIGERDDFDETVCMYHHHRNAIYWSQLWNILT
jgi:hypothetical protein